MKREKILVVLSILAALALSLSACMNAGREPAATSAPTGRTGAAGQTGTAAVTYMPDATEMPGVTAGASPQAEAFDWRGNAARIEEAIDQVSEISESRVVVAGPTALVGVKFASAYQGELTERIREMVAGIVREADPSIQTVAVTAEPGDVEAIYGFADQIQSGKNGNDLAEDINRIVRNITTLR